jgi:hypothetical protein
VVDPENIIPNEYSTNSGIMLRLDDSSNPAFWLEIHLTRVDLCRLLERHKQDNPTQESQG